jgi:xanthine dehydrogenase small subunit
LPAPCLSFSIEFTTFTMKTPVLRFLRRGELISLSNVPPTRTLLEVLREDLGCTAAKEGCGEGDCGACTVVLAQAQGTGEGSIRYQAINSCIRLAHSVNGMAVFTAEDLPSPELHPCQQAMVNCHASQCGFCTPGFVMSLFGMYQNRVLQGQTISREVAQTDLSGNLCRCTGYRPILDAAQQMASLPRVEGDATGLLQKLKQINYAEHGEKPDLSQQSYMAPSQLDALLQARADHPKAQLVAGCTDVGLWVTKQHRLFEQILDVTRVAELLQIQKSKTHLTIGAAVSLSDAYAALVADRPQLQRFAERFAGLPVRQSGTLGGNVANGSPIGDSMPLLIALGARVVLASVRGSRTVPLEALYTGYRQNILAADELLTYLEVPLAMPFEVMRVYKISKRQDDDISAVCLAVCLQLAQGRIVRASIGAGGVAATPVRALKTEAALQGAAWDEATFLQARGVLMAEFEPISDMRASAAYRREVLGNLLTRFWLDASGVPTHLEALA